MSKIAVIGIAGESVFLSVDDFGVTGETTVANSFFTELGGKGFNQALAVARYGVEVSFLGACYQADEERFSKMAKERGVTPFFVKKKECSPYAVIWTDKAGNNRVCVYRGAELSVPDVEGFEEEIKSADILLLTNETPVAVNERAVEMAKANDVRVILNPAPTRAYASEFLQKIDLFTPNEHETDGLDGYQNVIVTLGEKGCLIKSTGETIPARTIKPVVDTTGAGDTFNGVLSACIVEGLTIQMACKKACIASAIKVSRRYILDSIPTRKEIQEYERENGYSE